MCGNYFWIFIVTALLIFFYVEDIVLGIEKYEKTQSEWTLAIIIINTLFITCAMPCGMTNLVITICNSDNYKHNYLNLKKKIKDAKCDQGHTIKLDNTVEV